MVAVFAPRSNSSDACEAIVQYEANRPPKSFEGHMRDVNLAFFILFFIDYAITIPILWRWREKPRFRKVRPMSLSILFILAFALYLVPSHLVHITRVRCFVPVIMDIIALSWLAAVCTLRLLSITMETLYTQLAKKENPLIQDDQASLGPSMSNASTRASVMSFTSDCYMLIRIISGLTSVHDLTLRELAAIKHLYLSMFTIVSIPGYVIAAITIAATPPFQSCFDCDVFAEVPIAFSASMVFYFCLTMRFAVITFRLMGFDEQGVVLEMVVVLAVIAPVAMLTWLLLLFDPGNLNFDRKFTWSVLFSLTTYMWWMNSFAYQIYRQWKVDRTASRLTIVDMQTQFQTDPSLRKEFMEFAERHYILESLQFLEDIQMFKRYFFEKADNWKMSKFKSLVETYVLSGSKMEVNISFAMRSKIIKLYELHDVGKVRDIYTVFDQACKEVERMVHDGAWTDFLMKRQRYGVSSTSGVVPMES